MTDMEIAFHDMFFSFGMMVALRLCGRSKQSNPTLWLGAASHGYLPLAQE